MTQDTARALLDELGIDYETQVIDVAKIDKQSVNRKLRSTDPDSPDFYPHLVEEYALAMIDGDQFPPITVRHTKNGRYFVLDGVHRWKATEAIDGQTIDALVADVTPESGHHVALIANTRHGERLPLEVRVEHAAELVEREGMTQERAARLMRVSKSSVSSKVRQREAMSRALDARIEGFERLSPTRQEALNRIKLEQPFVEASRTAISHKLSADEVDRLVKAVRGAQNEAAAIQAARTPPDETDNDDEVEASTPRRGGPVWQVGMGCKNIASVTEDGFLRDLAGKSSDERAELTELCRKTATRLSLFADAAAS